MKIIDNLNTIRVVMNPYQENNRISINGKAVSRYSELNNYRKEPFLKWANDFFDVAEEEVNDEYKLIVEGDSFQRLFLEDLRKNYGVCRKYETDLWPLRDSSKERMTLVNRLAVKHNVNYDKGNYGLPIYMEGSFISEREFLIRSTKEQAFLMIVENIDQIPRQYKKKPFLVLVPSHKNLVTCIGDMQYIWELEASRLEQSLDAIVEHFAQIPMIAELSQQLGSLSEIEADEREVLELATAIEPIIAVGELNAMEEGSSQELSLNVLPAGSELPPLRIVSCDKEIVEIEGKVLRALSAGKTHIEIYRTEENFPFIRKEIEVFRDNCLKKISFDSDIIEMGIGDNQCISIKLEPREAEDAERLIWNSSDESILSIKEGRELIAHKEGNATVTVRATRASAEMKIRVLPDIARFSISLERAVLYVAQKTEIQVCVEPENCYSKDYEWESSDENVAVIERSDGKEMIQAKGIGTCTLTCKARRGSCYATCDVQVESTFKNREKKHKYLAATAVMMVAALLCMGFSFPVGAAVSAGGTIIFGIAAIKNNKNDGFWAVVLIMVSMAATVLSYKFMQ